MSCKREIHDLRQLAESHGWVVTYTGSGHLRFKPPDGGAVIFAPSTPSDRRAVLNVRAQLRRQGLPR